MAQSEHYPENNQLKQQTIPKIFYSKEHRAYCYRDGETIKSVNLHPEIIEKYLKKQRKMERSANINRSPGIVLKIGGVVLAAEAVFVGAAYAKEGNPVDAFEYWGTSHSSAFFGGIDKLTYLVDPSAAPKDNATQTVAPTPETTPAATTTIKPKPIPSATKKPAANQPGPLVSAAPETPSSCVNRIPNRRLLSLNLGVTVDTKGNYSSEQKNPASETLDAVYKYDIGGVFIKKGPVEIQKQTASKYKKAMKFGGAFIATERDNGTVTKNINSLRFSDDIGAKSIIGKNGKVRSLEQSVVLAWGAGDTPLFGDMIKDSKNLSVDARIDSLLDAGEKAIKDKTITRETLIKTTVRRQKALGISACKMYPDVSQLPSNPKKEQYPAEHPVSKLGDKPVDTPE